jgi:hypothetical protein
LGHLGWNAAQGPPSTRECLPGLRPRHRGEVGPRSLMPLIARRRVVGRMAARASQTDPGSRPTAAPPITSTAGDAEPEAIQCDERLDADRDGSLPSIQHGHTAAASPTSTLVRLGAGVAVGVLGVPEHDKPGDRREGLDWSANRLRKCVATSMTSGAMAAARDTARLGGPRIKASIHASSSTVSGAGRPGKFGCDRTWQGFIDLSQKSARPPSRQ